MYLSCGIIFNFGHLLCSLITTLRSHTHTYKNQCSTARNPKVKQVIWPIFIRLSVETVCVPLEGTIFRFPWQEIARRPSLTTGDRVGDLYPLPLPRARRRWFVCFAGSAFLTVPAIIIIITFTRWWCGVHPWSMTCTNRFCNIHEKTVRVVIRDAEMKRESVRSLKNIALQIGCVCVFVSNCWALKLRPAMAVFFGCDLINRLSPDPD